MIMMHIDIHVFNSTCRGQIFATIKESNNKYVRLFAPYEFKSMSTCKLIMSTCNVPVFLCLHATYLRYMTNMRFIYNDMEPIYVA